MIEPMIEPILLAWFTAGVVIEGAGAIYEARQGYNTRETIEAFMLDILLWPMFMYEVMTRAKER